MNGDNEPHYRELLERIVRLETEKTKLTARIEDLEKRASNSHECFMRLARQVGDVIHEGVILDAQVWELMEKVYPGHKKTQWQILDVLNRTDKTDPQGEGQPG